MGKWVQDNPVSDVWPDAASPLTLATTAQYFWVPGTSRSGVIGVELYPDADTKVAFCPRIQRAIVYDDSAGTYTDSASELQDADSATGMTASSLTSSDAIYIVTEVPILGFYVDMSASVNGTASVMTVKYWNGSWTDTSDTDGTASGGATLAQDGLVYWAAKTDETTQTLANIASASQYAYQITFGSTLDSSTVITQMTTLSRRTASQLPTWLIQGAVEKSWNIDKQKIGGFQVVSVSGTPNLEIHWIDY